jgi:hypothetical protein
MNSTRAASVESSFQICSARSDGITSFVLIEFLTFVSAANRTAYFGTNAAAACCVSNLKVESPDRASAAAAKALAEVMRVARAVDGLRSPNNTKAPKVNACQVGGFYDISVMVTVPAAP